MSVRVVTDSPAALPPHLAAERGIGVVPAWVAVGDQWRRDGEVSVDELLAAIEAGERVTTSAPSPGDYSSALSDCQEGEGVLVLTVTARLSASHRAASLAVDEVDGPVRVLDTTTAAGAQALVALAAAEAAAGGADLAATAAAAEAVIERVRLVATLESLDFLARSGRVPGIAAWAGRRLSVAPLFELRDGEARRLRPAFGRSAALERIAALCTRGDPGGGRLHVVGMHTRARQAADALLEQVRAAITPATAFVAEFSTAMAVHTGPGLAGLAWWWEPPDQG